MNHEVRGHEDARRHGGGGLYAHQSRAPGWGDLPSGPSCVTPSPHLTVSASSSSSLVIPHPHLPSKPVLSRARAAPALPTQDAVQWNGRVTAPVKTDLTALGSSGQKRCGFFHTSIPQGTARPQLIDSQLPGRCAHCSGQGVAQPCLLLSFLAGPPRSSWEWQVFEIVMCVCVLSLRL